MRLDPHPLFRKVITPWYDGTTACWMVITLMVGVVLFSVSGIVTARNDPDFHRHLWAPVTLLVLSLFVIVSIAWRLIQRVYARHAQTREP